MTGARMTSLMFHAPHRAVPTKTGCGFNGTTYDGLKRIST